LLSRLVFPASGDVIPAGPDYCGRVAAAYLQARLGDAWSERPAVREILKIRPTQPARKQDRDRKAAAIEARLDRLGLALLDRWHREAIGPSATWRSVSKNIALVAHTKPPSKDQLHRAGKQLARIEDAIGTESGVKPQRELTGLHRAEAEWVESDKKLRQWIARIDRAAEQTIPDLRGSNRASKRSQVASAAMRGETAALESV
jgi:hypothetical protein